MAYNNKWTPEFPASVGNALRPTDPINNTEDYQTDGFPQFIANDPVRYDLQNAVLKQVLSNDERLNEKIGVTNLAHNTDPKAHATGIAGNAATATKLAISKNISITGDATGSVSFDGSGDVSINATLVTVPIAKGGTGAITPAGALVNFNLTATAAELNYVHGVTSNVQNQINTKAPITSPTFAGTVAASEFDIVGASSTGIGSGNGDTGYPVADQKANLKISSWQGTGFYDGCTGNGYTVGINNRNGDIVSKGCVTANTFRTSDWFRTTGDGGWYSEKWGGGWQMTDATWIRAASGKNVYTSGVFQADGGFNGGLNGTATYAERVQNDGGPMRFHWNGQGGQPLWVWGNRDGDSGNAYVWNPSNFNVNSVGGYTADALKNRTSGRNTPVLTPLLDKSQGAEINTNTGTGIQGQGKDDLHLTQSYQNFDKILICWANDNLDFFGQTLWEKWELDYAFGNTYRFSLHKAGDNPYWNIWSSVNLGTSTHLLSTPTLWRTQDQNSMIKEIYGLTY